MVKKDKWLAQLGAQIRRLRADAGYSQEGFALDAGLDRTYYSGIERGERNVAAINLIRIAMKLKIEVGDLFPAAAEFDAPAKVAPPKRGRPKLRK